MLDSYHCSRYNTNTGRLTTDTISHNVEKLLGIDKQAIFIILAVFTSAGLFSAHHHVIFTGGQLALTSDFVWSAFIFRTAAGVSAGIP